MRRRLSLGLLCLTLAACARQADIIVTGGMVWTGLSNGAPQKGAVALANGKILAVGDSAQIARYAGPKTQAIQADGGLVLPGFTDGHTHFIDGGFQLASVDLRNAATPKEFIRRIKDYAKTLKPGEWITGGDWDHTLWPGQPLPHHEWIDSITPSNPVFVNRLDGHEALANAAAMRAAAVTQATPTPSGGEILRDPRTGEPTGIFKDRALDLVGHAIPDPSPAQRDSALARALAYAASLGVAATAHVSASWADLASYRRLEQAGRLTMRVALYLPLDSWRAVAETVSRSGRGDDWVKIGGLKGYMDGSAGSRTAYFFELYSDSAGYNGLFEHPEAGMRSWIGSADSAGPRDAPFRTLLDTGAKLAFGSDWTVAPLDPILGVYAAVTRRTLDGKNPNGWVPEQKISVGEALRAYTAGNAYATFDEGKRGTLAPGADADVVVLDRNLFAIPPDSLDRARVRYTIVGGRVVYRR